MRGGSVVIYGDGTQSRDYVFIDDVVDALVEASRARDVDRLTMNIGWGLGTTVNELIRTVERATGRRAHVLHNLQESGGVSRLCADITLAREHLGYRPMVELEEGLGLTSVYYQ